MSRTTVDIDEPILAEVKRLGRKERRSLGRLVSQLLAEALAIRSRKPKLNNEFQWASRAMEPQVDILDKDSLWSALDRSQGDKGR